MRTPAMNHKNKSKINIWKYIVLLLFAAIAVAAVWYFVIPSKLVPSKDTKASCMLMMIDNNSIDLTQDMTDELAEVLSKYKATGTTKDISDWTSRPPIRFVLRFDESAGEKMVVVGINLNPDAETGGEYYATVSEPYWLVQYSRRIVNGKELTKEVLDLLAKWGYSTQYNH